MIERMESRRGQPIVFFGILLVGWVVLRIATWQPPWPTLTVPGEILSIARSEPREEPAREAGTEDVAASTDIPDFPPLRAPIARPMPTPIIDAPIRPGYEEHFVPGQRAAGHNMLWLSAMAGLPMPRELNAALTTSQESRSQPTSPTIPFVRQAGERRWHADAWLLLRDDASPRLANGAAPASYGSSQVGAVLAYRLAPNARRDPAAYVRASRALADNGDAEVAIGVRGRVISQLPVNAHAEVRAVRGNTGSELRPAAFLSGGIDDMPLPLGLSASGYAQAGAVGGSHATAFADGAARIDSTLLSTPTARLDAGLGAWGGVQRDVARVDVGPTAGLKLELGKASARLAADWRWRIAGNAEPSNGAAITLSTGF